MVLRRKERAGPDAIRRAGRVSREPAASRVRIFGLRHLIGSGWVVGALAAALSVAASPGGARAQPDTSGATCTEVPSQVSFNGLHVLPEAPRVGDEVEVRFDVELLVFSVTHLTLEGARPLL